MLTRKRKSKVTVTLKTQIYLAYKRNSPWTSEIIINNHINAN